MSRECRVCGRAMLYSQLHECRITPDMRETPRSFRSAGDADWGNEEAIVAETCRQSAEAPQGETGRICVKCGGTKIDRQGRECRYCSWKPAAQPETGGDEARVREIVERWVNAGHLSIVSAAIVTNAVHAGIAAGRAAENEACETQLRKQAAEHEEIAAALPYIAESQMIRANCLNAEADAIAKRRGSVK